MRVIPVTGSFFMSSSFILRFNTFLQTQFIMVTKFEKDNSKQIKMCTVFGNATTASLEQLLEDGYYYKRLQAEHPLLSQTENSLRSTVTLTHGFVSPIGHILSFLPSKIYFVGSCLFQWKITSLISAPAKTSPH